MLTPMYDKAKLKIYTANRGVYGLAVCTAYSQEEAEQVFKAEGFWVRTIEEHEIASGLLVCNYGDE